MRAGYACVPAATLFQNGNLCETARYAEMYDPLSAASCAEFRPAASPLLYRMYDWLSESCSRFCYMAPSKLN